MSLTDRHFIASVDSAVELLALCVLGVEFDIVDKNSIAAIRGDQAMQVGQFGPVTATSLDFLDAFGVKIDHDAALGYTSVQRIWKDDSIQGAPAPCRDARGEIKCHGTE